MLHSIWKTSNWQTGNIVYDKNNGYLVDISKVCIKIYYKYKTRERLLAEQNKKKNIDKNFMNTEQ